MEGGDLANDRGDNVVATARDPRTATTALDGHGGRRLALAPDVTDADDYKATAGAVHGLVPGLEHAQLGVPVKGATAVLDVTAR